ncbi:MAG TPA: hypothetical protein VF601_09000 [Beijerinckiaceae bacterium]|jgi:hypothetical protein
MSESNVDVRSVIACDDVRVEATGKSIFIGIYDADIAVSAFPIQLNLSFVIIANVKKAANIKLNTRILGPSGDPLGESEISFDVLQDHLGIMLPPHRLTNVFSSAGYLTFQAQVAGEWKDVARWRVEKGAVLLEEAAKLGITKPF